MSNEQLETSRRQPRKNRRPGYRIGPFTFVPGLQLHEPSEQDPWRHRKGEPRVLVLFWTIYLMAAAVLTILGTRTLGVPNPAYAYGGRALLMMAVLGLGILWPVTRLSQVPPARPLRATLVDLVALHMPLQALVWPLPLVTSWTWQVGAALAAMLMAWSLLLGAAVLAGSASPSRIGRIGWMAACLAMLGAAPALQVMLVSMAGGGAMLPRWWSMLSPLTAIFQLTAAPSGLPATVESWEIAGALWPGAAGLAAGAVLMLTNRSVRGGES